MKKILTLAVILFIYATLYIGWQETFGYFGIFPYCNIDIESGPYGEDRDRIKNTIKTLKQRDRASYNDLCSYVNVVSSRYCFTGDFNTDPSPTFYKGCYVRGTKTVYLSARNDLYSAGGASDVKLLALYARASRIFWNSQKD